MMMLTRHGVGHCESLIAKEGTVYRSSCSSNFLLSVPEKKNERFRLVIFLRRKAGMQMRTQHQRQQRFLVSYLYREFLWPNFLLGCIEVIPFLSSTRLILLFLFSLKPWAHVFSFRRGQDPQALKVTTSFACSLSWVCEGGRREQGPFDTSIFDVTSWKKRRILRQLGIW